MPGAFIRALTRLLRRRAKRHLGLRSVDEARVGAVTFIQRSDAAMNVHFHTLALDGVYVRDAQGVLVFHAQPPASGVGPRRDLGCGGDQYGPEQSPARATALRSMWVSGRPEPAGGGWNS